MKTSTITTFAGLALASSLHGQGIKTTEGSYLAATPSSDFTVEPLITVGDRVPVTPGTAPAGVSDFAFCGIPDAMGIYKDRVSGQNVLFVAHEIGNTSHSRPFPGQTRYKGAWVSRFVMSPDGGVVNGSVAHKELFLENTFQAANAPLEGDATGFTRFCSGAFAGPEHGMDRPLFLTNEESSSGLYDVKGAQTVVIADGKMYTVPDLGRVTRETSVVQPRRDALTVIVSTEDGPATGNAVSYIYMYVGTKQRRSTSVLDKNGLTDGKIYVLAGRDSHANEGTFTSGSLPTKWVEIVNGAALTANQLSAAADLAGGFGFVRTEDAEFDPNQPTRSLFVATTGGSGPNPLGRLYEVTFNPTNPTANGTLNVVYNASNVINPGGTYNGTPGKMAAVNGVTGSLGTYSGGGALGTGTDFPVSIDNIAVSGDFIVVCEDRNSPADAVFAFYGRNGGAWTLDRNNSYAAKLQTTFNYAYTEGRDGNALGSNSRGQWETSGVIASDAIFGAGTFVINVQAHPVNANYHRSNAPNGSGGSLSKAQAQSEFAEDGQVLILRPKQPN
ncbi:MAG: hypothetical protein V4584_02365 [Verrucomicrobiota bacterium]